MMCLSLGGKKSSLALIFPHPTLTKCLTHFCFVVLPLGTKGFPQTHPVLFCRHVEGYTELFPSLCGPLSGRF